MKNLGTLYLLFLTFGCGSVFNKQNGPAHTPPPAKSLNKTFDYGILGGSNISLQQSFVNHRVLADRVYLQKTTIAPEHKEYTGKSNCAVLATKDLYFRDVSLNQAAVCSPGTTDLVGVDQNIPFSAQLDVDMQELDRERTLFIENVQKLSLNSNMTAVRRNNEMTFEPLNDEAIKVVVLADTALQSVQKIEIKDASRPILIVVKGTKIIFNKITMSGAFDPTKTLMYFPDAGSAIISNSLIRGAVLAPYKTITTTKTHIDGSMIVLNVVGDLKVIWNPLLTNF